MLMNEKMYQRVAALVAERLRRKEALASSSQAKRDQQSLATSGASISEVGDIVDMVAERLRGSTPEGNRLQSLSPAFDSPNLPTPASQRSDVSISRSSSSSSNLVTPASQRSGVSISRSSSSASFSRASSTASLGDGESQIQIDEEDDDGVYDYEDTESADSNDDEDDDEGAGYDSIKHKRGKKTVYTCQDRTDVTVPVLNLLDSSFLAPPQSELYPQGQKKRNGDFKKYAPLDFDCFKDKIKGIIRGLAANNSDAPNIHQRLFWAAYDVVRKRRANHMQCWRLYGYPKDLIYGGKKEFIKKHGDPWAKKKHKRKRKRRRRTQRMTPKTSKKRRKKRSRKGVSKKLNFEEEGEKQQQFRDSRQAIY